MPKNPKVSRGVYVDLRLNLKRMVDPTDLENICQVVNQFSDCKGEKKLNVSLKLSHEREKPFLNLHTNGKDAREFHKILKDKFGIGIRKI